MDLTSIAIAFVLMVSAAALIVVIRYLWMTKRPGRYAKMIDGHRGSEMVISEVMTYKETKDQMARFKVELEKLGDLLDSISIAIVGDSEEAAVIAYADGIPKTRKALIETRNAAESLLALVEKRRVNKQIGDEVFIGEWNASTPISFKSRSSRRQAEQLLDHIKRKTSDVRPCIAGFYFALTIPDEELRISEASEQISLVVRHIDDAIIKTVALEKVLV
jgi:hypothetical protein